MFFLILGFGIHFLRHGMIFPLIPLYVQSLGAGESMVGVVVACFHILAMVLAIPLGSLMERFGLQTMLAAGAVCNVLYAVLLLVATSLWIVMLAQVIGGLGFLLLVVATQTHIGSLRENRFRERRFGIITLVSAVGQTLGPALGGVVFSWAGYSGAFWAALGLSMVGAVSVACLGPDIFRGQTRRSSGGGRQIMALLRNTHLVCTLFFTFSVIVVVSLRGSFLPLLLQQKGISEGQIGVLLSCFALAMTVIRVGVGRILGRTSRLNVLIGTLSCIIVGAGTLPLLDSSVSLSFFLALFGLGFGLSQPLSMVMISDVSGSGLAMGVRFFTITSANFLSSLTMGWIAEYFSLSAVFYLGAGFLAVMGLWISWTLASQGANRETEEDDDVQHRA
ncbi:MFS transporter [Desulfovermiculus halophilus]|jgi:predicted MFS family arabinose efflux permease|uniref:MFS transporter n=1 Tax=Desulfovermiculus halophilus TaxID=339722 RepID=UPI000482E37C|nr:MFS transporter [Desulfovermiculus halophilus]